VGIAYTAGKKGPPRGAGGHGNYEERELIMRFSSTNLEPFEASEIRSKAELLLNRPRGAE
jgi:hypothetical protein